MKNLIMSLAIGAGALLSSGANAAPLAINPSMQPDTGIEQVRLVCDDYGRCYRTRGGRRVVIQRNTATAIITSRESVTSNAADTMTADTLLQQRPERRNRRRPRRRRCRRRRRASLVTSLETKKDRREICGPSAARAAFSTIARRKRNNCPVPCNDPLSKKGIKAVMDADCSLRHVVMKTCSPRFSLIKMDCAVRRSASPLRWVALLS